MSNNKITLASIFIFAMFVSAHFLQTETQAQESLVVPDAVSPVGTNQKGREILDLLTDLKKVRLDESIFSDPAFQSLKDLSVELTQEPKGRPNPFAPLGRETVLGENFTGFATASPRNIPFSSAATAAPDKSSAPIIIPVSGL